MSTRSRFQNVFRLGKKKNEQNEQKDEECEVAGGSRSKTKKTSSKVRTPKVEFGEQRVELPKVEPQKFIDDTQARVEDPEVEKAEDCKESEECEEDEFDFALLPSPTNATKSATQRIYKELKMIIHNQNTPNDLGFHLRLDKLNSVYQWVVQLSKFDPSIPLAQDMARHKVKSIDLEIRFAPDYPNLPPYIRVIRPRLLRFMNGGGGHVTAGGSICMDLLTMGNARDQGWSPEYTMEAVLIQVKLALSTLTPPARLDRNWKNEYSPSEAMSAYIRVANQHGWGIPPQWDTLFKR